ncbi:MAG: hypothetical protein DLM59_05680, partial [Pseudonocardiales bacterium]
LVGLPLAAVEKLMPTLTLPSCEGLLGQVTATQHAVRGALLERAFAVTKGNDWDKAARFVSVLDDPGITKNIANLTAPDLKRLAKGARNGPGGGDPRLIGQIRAKIMAGPGELFGKVSVRMAPKDGVDTGPFGGPDRAYTCQTDITFTPDIDVVDATSIAFVQSMSLLGTTSKKSEDDRKGMDERLNAKGQGIDRAPTMRSGWYQQNDDGTYAPKIPTTGVIPGFAIGTASQPATMTDTPDGKKAGTTWSYETSIIAQEGKDKGLIYAVVTWSFVVDDKLRIVDHKHDVADRPTADFAAAVGAWNRQAAGSSPQPKGQQQLPVFRSVDPATPVQRCGSEVHDGCACAEDRPVQRQVPATRTALDAIQGAPMYDLLPRLAAQPAAIRADETAGQASGGPRLVTAMRAVAAKGSPWEGFLAAQNARLASLPPDQIGDIITFLGGPKEARYYKAGEIKGKEFGGKFDGLVDPVAGAVTLYFRVRFDADGVRWGPAPAGTPEAAAEAVAGRAKFEADFKGKVESTWSYKGKVKPACAIGKISAFTTKVVVTVVEAGEHTLFKLWSEAQEGRSNAKPGEGNLKTRDTEERTGTSQVSDPTGKHPEQVTTTQAPAAHEFGHALGLHHPHCPGADDVCYGVTAEERRDIMGAGNLLQVIRRGGKVVHDDFGPFEAIAKTWGDEKLTGALAPCNTWSAV